MSQACKVMGYSRDTFYRFRELYDVGGELALKEISRKKPVLRNRVEEHIEEAIVKMATDSPALGQVRVSNEFKIFYSATPSVIPCIYLFSLPTSLIRITPFDPLEP